MGEYVSEGGPGVRTLDDIVHESARPGEQGTSDAGGPSGTDLSSCVAEADRGGAVGALETHEALVASRGATVSSALQAMAQGGYTHLFLVRGAKEQVCETELANASEMSSRTPLEGTFHVRTATGEPGSSGQESREASDEVLHVVYAKEIISLLSPTSSLELGAQWKGFFENALGLSGDVERTRKTSFERVL